MGDSSIEWVAGADGRPGKTWNPIRARELATGKVGTHCEKPSTGCANCYAEAHNRRNLPAGGTGLGYTLRNRELVEIFVDQKTLLEPLHWLKPRKVFPCSLTDLFGEFVTDEQIDQVFAVMALSGRHTYLILTKRAKRMYEYIKRLGRSIVPLEKAARSFGYTLQFTGLDGQAYSTLPWPIPNVVLGISAEDQSNLLERGQYLVSTPAVRHMISYEPALGPIQLNQIVALDGDGPACDLSWIGSDSAIDLVIVGGESGSQARAFEIGWARDVIRQCAGTMAKVFIKQLGYRPFIEHQRLVLKDRKGGDMNEWLEDLRVRELLEI